MSGTPAELRSLLDTGAPMNAADAETDAAGQERRSSPRASYERRVPAFGERAMRVLMARDLSMGGMRVEHESGLQIGDRLHLAIYGAADEEPFLVWASVDRDDGDEAGFSADLAVPYRCICNGPGRAPDRLPAAQTAAAQQHGETVRPVIAPGVAVD